MMGGFRDQPRYTATAMALHWITAAFVLAVLPLAWVAISLPRGPDKTLAFDMHKSVGLTILALVAARLLWRRWHPAPPQTYVPRGLALIGRVSHWLLYAIFILMPVSGYLLTAAHGRPVPFFYLFDIPALPRNDALHEAAEAVHVLGQWAVYTLVVIHVLASAWHVAIRRDGVLDRMLPRQGL